MSRPCSSQVYQVTPTPDSWATSSRRRPGIRRRPDALPSGSPVSAGVRRARWVRRKPASSARRADGACERSLVTFLTNVEVDALLASPDRSTWTGRRDHALLLVAIQTGLRVSELTRLTCGDVQLGAGAHLSCYGKGRKERITPLTSATVAVLRNWMKERAGIPADSLFPTRRGKSLSRDAVERRIAKYAERASRTCTTLRTKKVTPHVLRHTAAMRLLHAGVDTSVIALWLGHENVDTTQIYLHADLALKEKAIARTRPLNGGKPGRYRPSDTLLAFLEGL